MGMRLSGWTASAIAALALFGGQAATATPLGLDLLPAGPGADPDIFAGFGSATYTAATDQFVITMQPQTIFSGGVNYGIVAGLADYTLIAEIDDFGNLVSGSLTINGTAGGLGFNSGTLLTGTITEFGFDTALAPFEFVFDVTGGDAAGLWGSEPGGIILTGTGFGGSFGSDFSSAFAGTSDTGVVIPEPSTGLLFGVALLILGLSARRRAA